ncbi:hypothetical protein CGMCC3_g516 [Colletotrichum fructicola]|nr:uncharacterized protein CGMCC3_g516 [Colletotrichum fructicola]KAE9583397.1 hypothetical protein CGMCC3_g516 [Colletotrichum fructicola]KAF4433613.1 hypothetical protein CFRS1_v011789 [Colletotrichum fructicola]
MCSILSSHSKRFLLCKQHHKSDHFRPSPPALLYAILYRTVGPITREVTLVLSTAPLESRAQPCRLYHRIQRVDRRTIVPDLAPQQRKNPTHVHLTSRTRNENRHRPQNFH